MLSVEWRCRTSSSAGASSGAAPVILRRVDAEGPVSQVAIRVLRRAAPAQDDSGVTIVRMKSFLVSLLLALPALAGVVGRDVERELRERGTARVIVMMRDGSMPALDAAEFATIARWHHATAFAGVVLRESAIAKLEADPNVRR